MDPAHQFGDELVVSGVVAPVGIGKEQVQHRLSGPRAVIGRGRGRRRSVVPLVDRRGERLETSVSLRRTSTYPDFCVRQL